MVHGLLVLSCFEGMGITDWMCGVRGRHAIVGSSTLSATEDGPLMSGVSGASELAHFKY